MEFLEKDLEEIIYLSDKDKLGNRGLYLNGKLKRQLKIGNYGIADLVEFERPYYHKYYKKCMKGVINVLELKKDKIGVSTFFQALNYVKGIRTYLEQRDMDHLFNFTITLIGKNIDTNSSFCYLGDLFSLDVRESEIYDCTKINIQLFEYKYGIDGLEFEEKYSYNLIDKGF